MSKAHSGNPIRDKFLTETFGKDFGEEKKEQVKYIADFPDLVDLVDEDGELKFLLFDGTVTPTYILQDVTYSCPQRKQLPPNMQIPRLDRVLGYAQKFKETGLSGDSGGLQPYTSLYESLVQLHKDVSELPDDGLYHILALWDFHTHVIELANYSPIVYFYSVAERGKSRTIKAMTWLARRGIRKGDVKDAQLIRDCTHLRATIAFDMTDFWTSVSNAGSKDVILNRYEKGLTVSRVNRPEKGAFQDTDYYDVFGPTVLATNEIISDIADTRSIPITMIKSTRDFEDDVTPERFKDLYEQLVAWRMCNLHTEWSIPKKIVRSRLGDIIRPLHQILLRIAPQYEAEFTEMVQRISKTKLTEKASSLTAEVLLAIRETINTNNAVNGVFACQYITNLVNKDKDEKEKLKSRRIGSIVKSLGFKTTQTSNNALGFFYQENLLTRLLGEYGVLTLGVPESPVFPESPDVNSEQNISNPSMSQDGSGDSFEQMKAIFHEHENSENTT